MEHKFTILEIAIICNFTFLFLWILIAQIIEHSEKEKLKTIYLIARDVERNHTYSNIYNCVNFTDDLMISLKKNNIPSCHIVGTYKNLSHRWVRVWINEKQVNVEATAGILIHRNIYWANYVENRTEYCL